MAASCLIKFTLAWQPKDLQFGKLRSETLYSLYLEKGVIHLVRNWGLLALFGNTLFPCLTL
jgi:hypothetical protein